MPTTTDEQWRATIDGAPHLSCEFWLTGGCTEGQARMRAWEIWSHARAAGSTPSDPMARFGLRVERTGATKAVTLPHPDGGKDIPNPDRIAA